MIDDPGKLYDPNDLDNPQGPTPKPGKVVSTPAPKPDPLPESNTGPSYSTVGGTDVSAYSKYMPEGVHPENANLDELRGARQSVGEQLAIRAGNLVPNMAAQVLDMIGYTGALATQWGDNRDYSNAFTAAADKIRNPFGEAYRHDNSTFALTDSAWWINNIAGLAEFFLPITGEAALAGGVMRGLAGGAAKLLQAGEVGTRVAQAAATLGTAAYNGFIFSAGDGAQVYQNVYNHQLTKNIASGMKSDEAKDNATHMAAQSAATAVQLSTAMMTVLDLGAIKPFFSTAEDTAKQVLEREMKQKLGESTEDWVTRVKGLKAEDFQNELTTTNASRAKRIAESAKMGASMLAMQFGRKTGEEEGNKGEIHGFLDQFKQLDSLFDRTMDKEGALTFLVGAVGGGLQTELIHSIIPSKFTDVGPDGNQTQAMKDGQLLFDKKGAPVYERKLVTPRTYDEWNTNRTFSNLRDALAHDIGNFADMQKQFLKAHNDGNKVLADELKNQMFNTAQLNAVRLGMVEPWKASYNEIAGYDNTVSIDPANPDGPTEAMQRGFAVDKNDNEYITKANKAAKDLDKYKAEYDKINQHFGTAYEANRGLQMIVDNVFNRRIDLMSREENLKMHEDRLAKMEADEKSITNVAAPDDYHEAMREYFKISESAQHVSKNLSADWERTKKALDEKDTKTMLEMIKKYRAVGVNADDMEGAVNHLLTKIHSINELQKTRHKNAEEAMENSSGFNSWKEANPDGTFSKYKSELDKKFSLSQINPEYRKNLEQAKAEHEIAASNYNDIMNTKTVHKFIGRANNWIDKLQADTEKQSAEARAELARRAANKGALDRQEKIQMNNLAEGFKKSRDENSTKAIDIRNQIEAKKEELKAIPSKIKEPLKYAKLSREIRQLTNEAKRWEANAKHADEQYQKYSVNTETPDAQPDPSEVAPDGTLAQPAPEPEVVVHTNTIAADKEKDLEDVQPSDKVTLMQDLETFKLHNKEGMKQTKEANEEIAKNIIDNPSESMIDGGESFFEAYDRVTKATEEVLALAKDNAVIVTHNTVFGLIKLLNEHGYWDDPSTDWSKNKDFRKEYSTRDSNTGDHFDITTEDGRVIHVARHGETEDNRDGNFRSKETKLTSDGVQGAINLHDLLNEKEPVSEIYSSPLKRAIETSNIIQDKTYQPRLSTPDIHELENMGFIASEIPDVKGDSTAKEMALQNLADIQSELTQTARADIMMALDELVQGEKPFTLDALQPQVDAKLLTQEQATQLLRAAQIVNDLKEDAEEQQAEQVEVRIDSIELPEHPLDVALTENTDSNYIAPVNESIAEMVPKEMGYHLGKKSVSALNGAVMTQGYHEVTKDGNTYMVTDPTALNTKTNPDILKPGKLMQGTEIKLRVDPKYTGEAGVHDELIPDEYGNRMMQHEDTGKYFNADGKVIPTEDNINNVPIEVVDAKTGEHIMYIHKMDWVDAQYPGMADHRNIVDTLYDADGNPIDNLQVQRQALQDLRNKVVEEHNGGKDGTEGKLGAKGTGSIIMNIEFNKNTEDHKVVMGYAKAKNPEKSLLPDKTLTLAIVQGGEAYVNHNYPFKGEKGYKKIDLTDGNIVAMLPGANGKHMYAPLVGQPLAEGKRRTSVTTAVRAMELYLMNDGLKHDVVAEINKLQKNTGHDISTEEGLRNFINQYMTYTNSDGFDDIQTSPALATAKDGTTKFLFSITNAVGSSPKGEIKVGWSFSGRPVVKASIVDGKLSPEFVEALEEGFNARPRAVVYTKPEKNLRGLNSSGTFKDAIYTADGRWLHPEHESYNEYVKVFSKTAVYGRNQLKDGTYIYTANPTIPVEANTAREFPTVAIEQNKTTDKVVVPDSKVNENDLSFFNELMNNQIDVPVRTIKSKEIGTASDNSKPLTQENLQELYNFTPEENRNGKTIKEAYEELSSRGHTFLSDGFNPFTRCL